MIAAFARTLRCRRGSVATVFAALAVPLVGMAALGAELGSWYLLQRRAQNAADAAAYSGALRLAAAQADSQTVGFRARQFAAQNGFCSQGDAAAYPGATCPSVPQGTTRSVLVSTGTYAAGSFTVAATQGSGNAVQVQVSQTLPTHFAALFTGRTFTVDARAIAQVQTPAPICALGLLGPNGMTIGGSSVLTGGNCTLMSNTGFKFNSTPQFVGAGWATNAVAGCTAPSTTCYGLPVPYNWYRAPVKDPLAGLNSQFSGIRTSSTKTTCSNNQTCQLSPSATAYGDLTINGGAMTLAAGTYFFSNATVKMTGGSLTGTNVSIVLLGNSSLTINGGTVTLTAPMTNNSYPALDGVLFSGDNGGNVNINGNGNSVLGGVVYFPNGNVTWGGNAASANNCTQVIAATLTVQGNSTFSSGGCPAKTVPRSQVVMLVR
jgi:Flp pilus assembly protein TadG